MIFAPAFVTLTSVGWPSTKTRALEELTSRKSGADIPQMLERLESIFDKTNGRDTAWNALGSSIQACSFMVLYDTDASETVAA
jgi:hypothetical protein